MYFIEYYSKAEIKEFIKPIVEEVKKEIVDIMAEDEITDNVSKSSKSSRSR